MNLRFGWDGAKRHTLAQIVTQMGPGFTVDRVQGMIKELLKSIPRTSHSDVTLDVLYCGETLWIFNKPASMSCQPQGFCGCGLLNVASRQIYEHRLAAYKPPCIKPPSVHLVHRLDTDTSGAVTWNICLVLLPALILE